MSRAPADAAPRVGERNAGETRAAPRVAKPALVRRLGAVDAEALAVRVDRLSDRVWDREDRAKPNGSFCFRHTRHIVFRFPVSGADPGGFRAADGWRLWKTWLMPPMRRAAAAYGFAEPAFPKVMLARLAAGHCIDTHLDGSARDALVHKVHVPLRTDPRAVATVDGERFHLAPGYAWELNNLIPHGARNDGDRDRIHLVFEVFDAAAAGDCRGRGARA